MAFEKTKEVLSDFEVLFEYELKLIEIKDSSDSLPFELESNYTEQEKWWYYWTGRDKVFPFCENPQSKFREVFAKEYKELNLKKEFFFCCLLETYKNKFPDILNDFKTKYPDSLKISAIKQELDKHKEPAEKKYFYSLASQETRLSLNFSRTAIIRFLINEAKKENYDINYIEDFHEDYFEMELIELTEPTAYSNFSNKLIWNGDKSNLVEVIEALIVNGNIKGTKKEIYETFALFFNEDLSNYAITVSKFTNRNDGNETKFLDELRKTLLDEINTKLEKKR